ncbi:MULTISPECIES: efflux RND transporter periplasmic adaptor subunit [Pseudoalteromonas]|uniref:HlyD family efflux transporter periplasmic adaptor subunit n=1 Tax=Pseudoalteromonas rubra TaxID=43658 RepID=A0A5S3UV36_9GAMM|nr:MULTISPECIES: efflux RND transporter periplasmic adaptor subunit [Pseudoalteromonas]MCG7562928.1 efflux RND transporter periplasmic adaptor subunit [Pseudoalteromonas sp. McH1-42]MEC4087894.1 efflux RND transporter periplasmic adaptor subunit [Pseudoalteromonas rubra]QPB84361.1 HlyD family efflux transporter periplasmic adaptor subunit [Pseudoalteromonas rubra]
MDIVRQKKERGVIKKYWYIPVFFIAFLVFYFISNLISDDIYVADADRVVFSEVKNGRFTVSVRGSGVLKPKEINWLASNVDGRVETLYVKPGNIVKKGDLIAKLDNPELVQKLKETQWELEAIEADAIASEIAGESALLDLEAVVLNAKLDFEKSKVQYNSQIQLREKNLGVVAEVDFLKNRLETLQSEKRWKIQQKRYEKMLENNQAQLQALKARLKKMKKIAERAQDQVDNLSVIATMDSVVQNVAIESGQRVRIGDNIAKLAQKEELIAELQIPELQVRSVTIGQLVTIDTRNYKMTGEVARVAPSVINGKVQIDVELDLPLSPDAIPDLTVDGIITVSNIDQALYVKKPIYTQSQSDAYVYKESSDGRFVERTRVKFGVGSVGEVQIISGLNIGDRIVVSDPSQWEMYEKVLIN